MLELKADGQAELELLKRLLPLDDQVSLTRSSVPAATQQQFNNMSYVIETQQEQLAQAQTVISEYQQALAALTGQPPQSLLPPVSPAEGSGLALSETPRRYITGGLGQRQSKAITTEVQTSQTFERSCYRPPSTFVMGCKRLMKPSLVLLLFCLAAWGVFQYVAPPIGNRLFPTATEPAPEPKKASEPPKPKSNLDNSATNPGSAASKAGTQPNALDL